MTLPHSVYPLGSTHVGRRVYGSIGHRDEIFCLPSRGRGGIANTSWSGPNHETNQKTPENPQPRRLALARTPAVVHLPSETTSRSPFTLALQYHFCVIVSFSLVRFEIKFSPPPVAFAPFAAPDPGNLFSILFFPFLFIYFFPLAFPPNISLVVVAITAHPLTTPPYNDVSLSALSGRFLIASRTLTSAH